MIHTTNVNKITEDVFLEISTILYENSLYPMNMTLAEWNLNQKILWLKLVDAGYVEENDANTFFKFGKIVRDYANEHDRMISFNELIELLKPIKERGKYMNPFLRILEGMLAEDSVSLLFLWKTLGGMGYVDPNQYGVEYKRFVNLCRDYINRHGKMITIDYVIEHIDDILEDEESEITPYQSNYA